MWPSSGSSYRITKTTVPCILNEMNSGIPEFFTVHIINVKCENLICAKVYLSYKLTIFCFDVCTVHFIIQTKKCTTYIYVFIY